ncbi:(d)CMP kinase [Orrella sp. 11846]|uniref:(d)CMP kinase n=1 Tax=Orrella sp. 11846 TaxID=3409913 RepID=UPI003B5CD9AA
MNTATTIPVIAIDGPTASGKGTVSARIAKQLGWHMLDSGAIYRIAAFAVLKAGINPEDHAHALELIRKIKIRFEDDRAFLDEQDVTQEIRQEHVGNLASRLAPNAELRAALLELQRDFKRAPGLVADGRDMGTVVFPDATLKIYLEADVEARARRRYQQLVIQGKQTKLEAVLADLQSRDARDMEREVAPLRPAEDAQRIDSSELSIDETVDRILSCWEAVKQ